MRWPIRLQLLVPMLLVVFVAIIGSSLMSAALVAKWVRQGQEERLARVASTLTDATATFPLTELVLRQMSGLSGAQFVAFDAAGNAQAVSSSFGAADLTSLRQLPTTRKLVGFAEGRTVLIGGVSYLAARLVVPNPGGDETAPTSLAVLYPEEQWSAVGRRAIYPLLVVAGAAVIVAMLVTAIVARRVVRPLESLRRQAAAIERGDFRLMPIGQRNDEIQDLACSINQMVEQLARYEADVRRNERLRTLGQLGAGMAHQIRNAATGARLALDLHRRDCAADDSETLDVAVRQMSLLESYLQRFLMLARQRPMRPQPLQSKPLDLAAVVGDVLPLVRPACEHAQIHLQFIPSKQPATIKGDSQAIGQMLINLLLNAIEAASTMDGQSPKANVAKREFAGSVRIEIAFAPNGQIECRVSDSGRGPNPALADNLAEPFISDKPDGTGLGLAVVRQIAEEHGAELSWRRANDITYFTVSFPAAHSEVIGAASNGKII
jgi:signal transduction histidine kinase